MTAGSRGVHIVLVDANVLASITLRDWLLLLRLETQASMFDVKWTEEILDETLDALERRKPGITKESLARYRERIVLSLQDGEVVGYEVPGTYNGPDPKDAHVHSAAELCGADILLTNDKGFRPPVVEDELPYEVYTADEFFVLVDDSLPAAVRAVTLHQIKYFWETRGSVELCQRLEAAKAPHFAERVRAHIQDLRPHIEAFAPSKSRQG
ncbi:PIN domain-containing protein [Georgenia alba]|uniref:PIN domain-containing protein n=1 Tax=Georgenia alba TaxID=2233858 RepID=A0ABW2Q203_9MICO